MIVGIVNFKMGNINSVSNALNYLGCENKIINTLEDFENITHIILPGVGSYKDAINKLKKLGWEKAIKNFSSDSTKSLFGICVGMQILSTYGYEYGKSNGLNIIEGYVDRMDKQGCILKLPHIGWNNIKIINNSLITENISNDSNFYFINSYSFKLMNLNTLIATTDYGIEFPSIINRQNIFGTQFHPEKSSKAGIQILKNFINA